MDEEGVSHGRGIAGCKGKPEACKRVRSSWHVKKNAFLEVIMDETMIAQQLERVDQRCKSNTHRLDEMEKRQDNLDKLVTSVEVLATKQQVMETDVKEIKINVKALTDKPGKRWEQLVSTVLSIIVGAVLGVLLAKVGLG